MREVANTAGMPNVKSRRAFFRFDIVRENRPLEMKFETTPDFSHSEMHAARGPFFRRRFGRIVSLAILSSSSVAAFRGPNSDSRNGVCFATSRQANKIIAPEGLYSYAVSLSVRPNSSSEGERCMKHTVHRVVHFSVHRRIFGKVRSRRSCTWRERTVGRGQNTGLGWSDPTFVHVSVPKVIRGVAPAQLERPHFCARFRAQSNSWGRSSPTAR
jgi:hypothetical protein